MKFDEVFRNNRKKQLILYSTLQYTTHVVKSFKITSIYYQYEQCNYETNDPTIAY